MSSRRLVIHLAMMITLLTGLGPRTLVLASPNDMGHNGLSSAALVDNALTLNPKALKILRSYRLNKDTFNHPNKEYLEMESQLYDPNALAVMKDLVSCALTSSSTLTYTNAFTNPPTTTTFQGELGLCTKDNDDWSTHLPSERCLQLVSACLFARVNAFYKSVPVSFRGPGDILPMRRQVHTEKMYRESTGYPALSEGTPVNSLTSYSQEIQVPPAPSKAICAWGSDCDWEQGYIGTCAGGSTINLQGSSGCNTSIRVCKGIYGCEENDAGISSAAKEYSGYLQQNSDCSIKFSCPFQGFGHGSYGVMVKSSSGRFTAKSGEYPAPETGVFTFREGAFFGNIFAPNGLTSPAGARIREVIIGEDHQPHVREVVTDSSGRVRATEVIINRGTPTSMSGIRVLYKNIYVCYSPELGQDQGEAYLNDRVCAAPNSNPECFPNPPVNCDAVCTPEAGKQIYATCNWNGTSYIPITTYLDDPCSLIDRDQCRLTMRALLSQSPIRATPSRSSVSGAAASTSIGPSGGSGTPPAPTDGSATPTAPR